MRHRALVLCCTLALLLPFATPVRADIAPPAEPPGSSIGPDDADEQLTVRSPLADPHVARIAAQLAAVLAVDPQNEGALQLLEELRGAVDGPLKLPPAQPASTSTPAQPTQEPTTAPTLPATATIVAEPTSTPQPGPTSAPTDAAPTTIAPTAVPPAAPTGNSGLPVVLIATGAALLAALGAVVGVILGRRRRQK